MTDAFVARIDALLPQTQCRRCGYPDCRGYAVAVAAAQADVNRCPPGGDAVLAALAALTGSTATALAGDLEPARRPLRVALIDERTCIGCTKCLQACPLDAIVGTGKLMHTVIAAECSGCELCLPPCPVDCITLPAADEHWSPARAARARERYRRRQQRLARAARRSAGPDLRRPQQLDADAKRAAVDAAAARARARREKARAPS